MMTEDGDTFLPSTGATMEGSVFDTSVLLGVGHVQPYFIVNEETSELYILYVVKYTGLFSTNFIFCDAIE